MSDDASADARALVAAVATSVATVERERISSEERVTLAAIEHDLEEKKLLFKLEEKRMANEHTRDGWGAWFVVFGIIAEVAIIVTAIVLSVKGHQEIANFLFGSGFGSAAGAGAMSWHHNERDRRERRRLHPAMTPVSGDPSGQ